MLISTVREATNQINGGWGSNEMMFRSPAVRYNFGYMARCSTTRGLLKRNANTNLSNFHRCLDNIRVLNEIQNVF